MSLHELRFIFQDNIRQVLDHFSRLMGLRFCFLTPDGKELRVGNNKPHCHFCRMVRYDMELMEQCKTCDRNGWKRATQSNKPVWYRCHAGLIDGCMAVRNGDRVIGYMMIGQFRTQPSQNTTLQKQWNQQFDNDDLLTAYHQTPYYEPQQIQYIMGVFEVLVNSVVNQRLIAVRQFEPIQPLLAYMAEHPEIMLSIPDAARLLHRSVSGVSHLFKQVMGKSFLQYQTKIKLELADEWFRTRQNITVREVAHELGFQDPYYFSRTYKKHRGIPPSQFIKRIAKQV